MKIFYISLLCLFAINFTSGSNNKILIVPTADFSANKTTTCVTDTVDFTDASLGTPTSWAWSFSPVTVTYQNGTDANSQNPEVSFDAIGEYTVTLLVTNVDGSDSIAKMQYVVGTIIAPFLEDFTSGVPPTNGVIINPDGLKGWESVTTTGSDGNSTQVIRMDNYSYDAAGQLDEFVLPSIDISGVTNPVLYFDVAYAAYDATNFERLHIEYSTDCGETFSPTTYDEQDLDLATVPYQTNGWGPSDASHWRAESVDLSAYSGSQIILKFIQTAGHGNGLFIDNIKVEENGALSNIDEEISNFIAYPNPSKGVIQIKSKSFLSDLSIAILDIQGRVVYTETAPNFNEIISIDLNKLLRGNYILKLISENRTYLKKIILK